MDLLQHLLPDSSALVLKHRELDTAGNSPIRYHRMTQGIPDADRCRLTQRSELSEMIRLAQDFIDLIRQ